MSCSLLPGCTPQSEQGNGHNDNNVVVFSNPPESQRFKGGYGPSFAAQQVIELDHYLMGYKGENPRLYIEYTNISNETVKIDIGIMWLVAHNDIVRQVGQHDIRPPISPGQSERLTYRPIVESPSEIVNYYIGVHSLLDEQLPHVAFGPQVGPEEVTTSSPGHTTIEVANFNLPDLIELRKVVGEVLLCTKMRANEDEKRLVDQAEVVLAVIKPKAELHDLVRAKTEEERLLLDGLATVFAEGLKYWARVFHNIDVPSPIGEAIAKAAEELGNQIAEWWWLGEVGFANITKAGTGVMRIVYDRRPGEVWVIVDVYNPPGQLYMYIPVEPALASYPGVGNVILSEGVKPVIDKCKIAYRFR